MNFKDLFSTQACDYAKFRPTYPTGLFDYLAKRVQTPGRVWDCGTGNGQAALELASRFEQVIATDPSEKQLAEATRHPKVDYRRASAESSGIESASIDLITVAQAFHWFRQPEFFAEAERVLKPGGVLAIWSYNSCKISPEIDREVHALYEGTLGSYWDSARKLVEEGYSSVALPFPEAGAPEFDMRASWTLPQLLGYLGTWSALQTYIKKNGSNPLEDLAPRLASLWGPDPAHQLHEVRWPLAVRIAVKDGAHQK